MAIAVLNNDRAAAGNSTQKEDVVFRVALLGNVSAGKTTLINALLRDRYGEVSKKRCTAGINFFHLDLLAGQSQSPNADAGAAAPSGRGAASSSARGTGGAGHSLSLEDELDQIDVQLIHQKITQANEVLRADPKIEEKHFHVSTTEPLVTVDADLRSRASSVKLVLIDVPGLNEQGSAETYKKYVREELFPTLDKVIVVMDVDQGVNSTEQVGLLNFVQECIRSVSAVTHHWNNPLVIVNKVDDPADAVHDETKSMIQEIEAEVAKIFGDYTALHRCIPLSAELGCIYRVAAGLNLQDFKKSAVCQDERYLNKIGPLEIGVAKWRKLMKDKKIVEVHKILSDRSESRQRLKDANFLALSDMLEHDLGADAQKGLLQRQVDYKLGTLSHSHTRPDRAVANLLECVQSRRVVDTPLSNLEVKGAFKTCWNELRKDALQELEEQRKTEKLILCIKQLEEFGDERYLRKLFASDGAAASDMQAVVAATRAELRQWIIDLLKAKLVILENVTQKIAHNASSPHINGKIPETIPEGWASCDFSASVFRLANLIRSTRLADGASNGALSKFCGTVVVRMDRLCSNLETFQAIRRNMTNGNTTTPTQSHPYGVLPWASGTYDPNAYEWSASKWPFPEPTAWGAADVGVAGCREAQIEDIHDDITDPRHWGHFEYRCGTLLQKICSSSSSAGYLDEPDSEPTGGGASSASGPGAKRRRIG
ncbi:unnamed protein product [Amoebophrya sp. A120]|nr:unnamed protein product [Amoebophrya sp. A120]|eukprot:GSA120T00012951001.1